MENIRPLIDNYPNQFQLITGDIRDIETCHQAAEGVDYILHQAALGSVQRCIQAPETTNSVNI